MTYSGQWQLGVGKTTFTGQVHMTSKKQYVRAKIEALYLQESLSELAPEGMECLTQITHCEIRIEVNKGA